MVLNKEKNAINPLNDLLKRIEKTIMNEDTTTSTSRDVIFTKEPLPFHNISTHDNLKESLCRSNDMKYRHDGFIGPIRDIFKYKTHPQKVKTPLNYSLSRRSLDSSDEYSMYVLVLVLSYANYYPRQSIPSIISIEGYITSHSHRQTIKIPKKKSHGNRFSMTFL